MDTKFTIIRNKLGFPTDEPLEVLLERVIVAKKSSDNSDKIALAYLEAELLRKLKRHQEAQQVYQQVTQLSTERTGQRLDKLSRRLFKARQALKVKLLVYLTIIVLSVMAVFFIYDNPEESFYNQELAFVKWLAERQNSQIISALEKKDSELFFENAPTTAIVENTIDSLLEQMNPLMDSTIDEDSGDLNNNHNVALENISEENQIYAPFSCSVAPIKCRLQDRPQASGKSRQDIFKVVNTYSYILETEKNCNAISKLIDMYSEKIIWRKEESSLKARLEEHASVCYYDQKNWEESRLHAKRVICSGSENSAITYGYLVLAQISNQLGEKKTLQQMLSCAEEYSHHFYNKNGNLIESANNFISTAANFWTYRSDLNTYLILSNFARNIVEELLKQGGDFYLRSTKAMLEMNLLEAYIIADDDSAFLQIVDSLNINPAVNESDRLVIQSLNAIRLIRQQNYKKAKSVIDHLIVRFEQTPEYMCQRWDWGAFKKWLDEEKSPKFIANNQKIKLIINALECGVKLDGVEKLQAVKHWLSKLGNSQKLIYPQHTPNPSQEGNQTVASPLLRGESNRGKSPLERGIKPWQVPS